MEPRTFFLNVTRLLVNAKEIQTLEKVLLNHKEIEYFGYYGSDVTTNNISHQAKRKKKERSFHRLLSSVLLYKKFTKSRKSYKGNHNWVTLHDYIIGVWLTNIKVEKYSVIVSRCTLHGKAPLNFRLICAVKQLAEFHTKPASIVKKILILTCKVVVNGLCYYL